MGINNLAFDYDYLDLNPEYLVHAIEGASIAWNVPLKFVSVVLLPIVGNATEHASSIMFAMKDKLDNSLGVAIVSSTQISMFGIPFSVLIGWIPGQPMDLELSAYRDSNACYDCISSGLHAAGRNFYLF